MYSFSLCLTRMQVIKSYCIDHTCRPLRAPSVFSAASRPLPELGMSNTQSASRYLLPVWFRLYCQFASLYRATLLCFCQLGHACMSNMCIAVLLRTRHLTTWTYCQRVFSFQRGSGGFDWGSKGGVSLREKEQGEYTDNIGSNKKMVRPTSIFGVAYLDTKLNTSRSWIRSVHWVSSVYCHLLVFHDAI